MSDLARWIVATEVTVLFVSIVSVVALEFDAARRAPRAWRYVLGGVVVFLFGVTVAVVLNALIAGPQTPGVRLLAYLAGPAALLGLAGVVVSARRVPTSLEEHREAHVIANARPLAEALSHIPHLEPCATPECVTTRRELSRLAGDEPA